MNAKRLAGLAVETGGTCYHVQRGLMLQAVELGQRVLLAVEHENAHPILDRGDRGGAIHQRAREAARRIR